MSDDGEPYTPAPIPDFLKRFRAVEHDDNEERGNLEATAGAIVVDAVYDLAAQGCHAAKEWVVRNGSSDAVVDAREIILSLKILAAHAYHRRED